MRVVVVDNSESDIALVRRELIRGGFEFIGFTDGREFLEWIVENEVDAILLDLAMPFDGVSVVEELQLLEVPAPIAFLTGELLTGQQKIVIDSLGIDKVFNKGDFDGLAQELKEWIG